MMDDKAKLHAICIGDLVDYHDDQGSTCTGACVVGWKSIMTWNSSKEAKCAIVGKLERLVHLSQIVCRMRLTGPLQGIIEF